MELFRTALSPELWPEGAVCTFLGAVKHLGDEIDVQMTVSASFTSVGEAAAAFAKSVRDLLPVLDQSIEKARTAISTQELLVDDGDRRFERHRRMLDAGVARQLDLLAKVRAVARPAASGSFERAPQVELRVVRA